MVRSDLRHRRHVSEVQVVACPRDKKYAFPQSMVTIASVLDFGSEIAAIMLA